MLCTAGHLTFDITVWLSSIVEGQQAHGEILHQMGGSAAIVAHNAAVSSSIPIRFVGLAGNDALSEAAIAQLRKAGVETRVVRRGRSSSVLIIVDEDGERTMVCDPGDAMTLQMSDIGDDWFEGIALVHLESWYLFDSRTRFAWQRLAQKAKRRGLTVTLDACSANRISSFGASAFRKCLAQVAPDVLLCNETEAQTLGLDFLPVGVGTVVIHRGAEPTRVVDVRGSRQIPLSESVDAIDTAGAGDSFAAGFCTALIGGGDIQDAVLAGHNLAAIVVSQRGCLIRRGFAA